MRTTLDIETDVLLAVKAIARRRQVSTGKVVSELIREALKQEEHVSARSDIPLFPIQPGAVAVTVERVNLLRDEMP